MKTLHCQRCGKQIDPAKAKKGGQKREPQFCSRECAVADRKARGFFQMLSRAGNQAQATYKQEHGKAPGKRGGARPHRKS